MITQYRPRLRIWLTLGFAATIVACEDGTSPASSGEGNPVAFAGGQFEDFTPISGSAACVAPPALIGGFGTYQPFILPEGYSQTILATEIADFFPVAGASGDVPDMLVLNETGPQAGRYLYRTHEVGSNGAVTVTDLQTGSTALVDRQSHYEALDGIV